MIKYKNIDDIKPAPYNPRKISDKQIETLKHSFQEIGFVIPVLVNKKNNVIIAGHQRTKTAKLIGIKEVPVMCVDGIVLGDEIKFNQIHNAVDKTLGNSQKLLKPYEKEKFIEIDPKDFEVKETMATVTKEICKLTLKYGNVLSCVVCKGKVVYGCEYVKACQLLGKKVNAYICDDSKYDKLVYYLGEEYGKYSYDGIKRDTYVQGLAQLNRSIGDRKDGKKSKKSRLYENMVLPYLADKSADTTILDFGCGKGAYINMLKKKFNAYGIEFYNNNSKGINISKGNRQIDALIKYLEHRKTFDVVVCDSVLNSVDSVEAEKSVMTCLNLFTQEKMFISGRHLESVKYSQSQSTDASVGVNRLYYLDADNFSANYREGKWFFQHFHTKDQIRKLMKEHGFEIVKLVYFSTSFAVECKKVRNLSEEEYRKAIDFEFNLPLPNGKRYGRNEEVKNVLNMGD